MFIIIKFQNNMDCDGILNLATDQHDIIDDIENDDHVMVVEGGDDTESNNMQQGETSAVKKRIFFYKLDLTKRNIFYSDIDMPDWLLRDVPEQFEWTTLSNVTLEQMSVKIEEDIKDPDPKLMILQCFGKQLLYRTNHSVIEVINHLTRLVDSTGIHQISPGTNNFIPDKPDSWEHTAQFNSTVRLMNIDRNLPPLSLHKAIMKPQFGDSGPLMIKGLMWKEFCSKDGLGSNLSTAGLMKLKHFVMLAFENHFCPYA